MDLKGIEPVTAGEVLELFGGAPSKGQLMKICETGVILPFRDARGVGSNRLFDGENLLHIGIWRELSALGIDNRSIREVLNLVRQEQDELEEHQDYLLYSKLVGGTTDPTEQKPSLALTMTLTLSRAELAEQISEGVLFQPPEGMEGLFPVPLKNVVIVDLGKVRASIIGYFEQKGQSA